MPIDKSNAIFKTETIDGKLYRVMYFKGRNGKMIRSKYPQLIKTNTASKKQPMKKKLKIKEEPQQVKSRPQLTTRVIQEQKAPHNGNAPRSGSANNLVNEWEELSRR